MCKVIFAEYRLPKKIMLGPGGNFISDKFKTFCKSLNIEQMFSSSYHCQSNRQGEACIKFVKCTRKKCFDTKGDPHIAVLQIRMTLQGPGLPSLATIWFNCPIRGIMPKTNRPPMGIVKNEEHYEVLVKRQTEANKNQGTPRSYVYIPTGSTVAFQWKMGDCGPMAL